MVWIDAWRLRAVRVASAVVLVLWICPRAARSADQDGAAGSLFAEGRRLAGLGNYAGACPMFEDSYRLNPGIGTNYNLADCLEHIGRTASAWARFLEVATATKAAGQVEREKLARARAEALEPKLARLTIVVRQPVEGLAVKRDASAIGEASWGIALPIDPGSHLLEASAPHKVTWSSTIDILDSPGNIRVEIPPLMEVSEPGLVPPIEGAATPRRGISTSALALGAVGIVGLTVGTIYGIKFLSDRQQLEGICSGYPYSPDACPQGMIDTANTLQTETTHDRTYELIGFGVGTVAIAAAVYLWWRVAPRSTSVAANAGFSVAPTMIANAWGISVASSR